jgi:hypothetical protein
VYLVFNLFGYQRFFQTGIAFTFPDLVWALYSLFLLLVFVWICVKPAYLHIRNGTLEVRHDFLYNNSVPISDIERIELETSPFSRSKILLKSKAPAIEFSYFDLSDKDFTKFRNSVPFPIE